MGFKGTLINKSVVQPAISASGSIVTFGQSISQNLKKLLVNISPVQSGTGDPSPTNIRPITGWTGANVYQRGKNFLDANGFTGGGQTSFVKNGENSYTFTKVGTGNSQRFTNRAALRIPAGVYTFSFKTSFHFTSTLSARFYINGAYETTPHTCYYRDDGYYYFRKISLPTGVTGFQIYFANNSTGVGESANVSDFLLERSDVVTEYEPFAANTYDISWSDSAGTVYGGTLDVVSGKLTVDRAYVTLSSLTWTRRGVRLFSASIGTIGNADVTIPASEHLCDYFPTEYVSSYTSTQALHLALYKTSTTVSSGSIYLQLTSAEISDSSAEFNQWLIDNPVHLCYKLRTPVTYQLTPTEVQTLLGVNNIWADIGDVEVETKEVLGRLRFSLVDKYVQVPPAPAAVALGSLSSPLNSPPSLVSVSPDIAEKEIPDLQMEEGPEEEPAEDPIVEEGENDDIE